MNKDATLSIDRPAVHMSTFLTTISHYPYYMISVSLLNMWHAVISESTSEAANIYKAVGFEVTEIYADKRLNKAIGIIKRKRHAIVNYAISK